MTQLPLDRRPAGLDRVDNGLAPALSHESGSGDAVAALRSLHLELERADLLADPSGTRERFTKEMHRILLGHELNAIPEPALRRIAAISELPEHLRPAIPSLGGKTLRKLFATGYPLTSGTRSLRHFGQLQHFAELHSNRGIERFRTAISKGQPLSRAQLTALVDAGPAVWSKVGLDGSQLMKRLSSDLGRGRIAGVYELSRILRTAEALLEQSHKSSPLQATAGLLARLGNVAREFESTRRVDATYDYTNLGRVRALLDLSAAHPL